MEASNSRQATPTAGTHRLGRCMQHCATPVDHFNSSMSESQAPVAADGSGGEGPSNMQNEQHRLLMGRDRMNLASVRFLTMLLLYTAAALSESCESFPILSGSCQSTGPAKDYHTSHL